MYIRLKQRKHSSCYLRQPTKAKTYLFRHQQWASSFELVIKHWLYQVAAGSLYHEKESIAALLLLSIDKRAVEQFASSMRGMVIHLAGIADALM